MKCFFISIVKPGHSLVNPDSRRLTEITRIGEPISTICCSRPEN